MSENPFRKTPKNTPSKKQQVAVSNRLAESIIRNNNEVVIKLLLYIGQGIQKREKALIDKKLPLEPIANLTTFTLPLKDVCAVCNVSDRRLKDSVKVLQKTVLSFENIEQKWQENITVIPRAKYNYAEQTFEVDMYKQVVELVANLQKQFTIIDIENAMRLNSAYAIRFIQILEMIDSYDENYGKRKSFNLAELNAIFGTNYKTIKHIVQKIILPMKQEFDKVSKLTFLHTIKSEANPAGRGRPKATEIMFEIIKNQPRLF